MGYTFFLSQTVYFLFVKTKCQELKKINKSQSLILRLTALSSHRSTGSKCEGAQVCWVGYHIAPWKSC